jgi:hypothetical protein
MAFLTIPTGSTFSMCRNNIDTMLVELGQSALDKESSFRFNRETLASYLSAELTSQAKTASIEPLATGSSFRQCRPAIRRMFIAAYV